MGSIKVMMDDGVEERFRHAGMERFGYGKGALNGAAVSALEECSNKINLEPFHGQMIDPAAANTLRRHLPRFSDERFPPVSFTLNINPLTR